MKRLKRSILYLIILAIPLAGLVYTFPRNTVVVLPGIEYRLGEPEDFRSVSIKLEGTFQRRFLDKNRFRGTAYIGGQTLRDVDVTLNPDGALMMVRNVETEKIERFGAIYSEGELERFTIAVLEPVIFFGQVSEEKFWDTDSGMMISVPAETREEALRISNEIMAHLLDEPLK